MHSLLVIIGDGNLEEMMNPYWQDLEVPEYCDHEVSQMEKDSMENYYKRQGEEFATFDELYEARGENWNGGEWRKDEDGVWRRQQQRAFPHLQGLPTL